MIRKFKKRPVIVEAMQYDGSLESAQELIQWSKNNLFLFEDKNTVMLLINTLEGVLEVSKDDWVIKGVEGEFYPCKPSVFEKTYHSYDDAEY